MLNPISKSFRGLIIISGPTKSGKSKLAEFLLKEKESITYIATSKKRPNDPEWQKRINVHKKRRPENWNIIENPQDICQVIDSIGINDSILIDSLGGLVEEHIMKKNREWESIQRQFLNCLIRNKNVIIVVSEEVGWGIVPATKIGHLFRERLSHLYFLLSQHSTKKWLAVNGTAIELDKIGDLIP
tara:strand:- start:2145 stop:2702 length:558 start_codon:yes stop_codon:yes gene_type:complete